MQHLRANAKAKQMPRSTGKGQGEEHIPGPGTAGPQEPSYLPPWVAPVETAVPTGEVEPPAGRHEGRRMEENRRRRQDDCEEDSRSTYTPLP